MEQLHGTIRPYPWGSRTLIPSLRGEPVPSETPQAELWYGAHPVSPSTLVGAGEALDARIARLPEETVGARCRREYGDQLPFLVKLLAAERPLSLQTHPSKAQAEEGFARENAAGIELTAPNRNYRDPNHKPELIVALTPFRAMAGFRPLARTRELFDAIASPIAERYLALLDAAEENEAASLRALFTTWISIPAPARVELIDDITARAADLACGEGWIAGVCETACALAEEYPGDVGVLGALLLNHVTLRPGEAIFLAAGQLHAYISGLGVEVMANSDNVLRGGLTSKYVDVPELVRLLSFVPLRDPIVRDHEGEYAVPVHDFAVRRVCVGRDRLTIDHSGPSVVLCTEGRVRVGDVELGAGDAAWLAACDPAARVLGAGEVFWVRS